MKSVVIRNKSDFIKIDEYTEEIEFVSYNELFTFKENCILPNITFTKMYVNFDILPESIKKLSLFDCYFDELNIEKLVNLKKLEITSSIVDVKRFAMLDIEELVLNFCTIENYKELLFLKNLKVLSLVGVVIDDFKFLTELKLEKFIIDDDNYEKHKEIFDFMKSSGIVICNMMGGRF